ncbi:MAG: hypothetical protein ACMUIE_00135 [Thermoplasmatota archaeon]
MKIEMDLIREDREVKVRLKGKRFLLDGEEVRVRGATLGKRRRMPTLKVIIILFVIIMAGVVLFAAVQYLFGSEDESDPYLELSQNNLRPFVNETGAPLSPIYLFSGSSNYINLENSVEYNAEDYWDVISIEESIPRSLDLNIMWMGDANELKIKGISHLRITFDSGSRHTVRYVEMVVLDDQRKVAERESFSLTVKDFNTGKTSYDILLDRMELGDARNMQSGESVNDKGCRIIIRLPDGIAAGEHRIKIEWGPEYYHTNTQLDLFIGAVVAMITLFAAAVVYFKIGRDEPAMIINDENRDIVLFGPEEDLGKLYFELSKITVSSMRRAETEEIEKGHKPGLTRGRDLIGREEAEEIGAQLENMPGGSGRMIVHQCPECGGTELYYESGFITGYVYHCKRCDYIGSFVIEKEVDFKDRTDSGETPSE